MSTQSSAVPPHTKPGLPPGSRNFVASTLAFQRDPLAFLDGLTKKYGDVSRFGMLNVPTIFVNHPAYIRHILQGNHMNYDKDVAAYRMARPLFGDGLATVVGGAPWRRQRRMLQPAFHRKRVAALAEIMTDAMEPTIDEWSRHAAAGEQVNVDEEMTQLTLRVVVKSLFASALDDETLRRFTRAVNVVTRELDAYMRLPIIPLSVPTPGHRRFWRNRRIMDDIIDGVIHGYTDDGQERDDILSMIMQSRDEETGEGLSHDELRDQVLILFFAGHETSASTLTWLWYLLAYHPDVEQRLRDEIDREVGDRHPTVEDIPKLVYTRAVIDETMRLYPSVFDNFRNTIKDDEIGGYRIPAGSQILLSAYYLHRHPDYWAEPETFDPERFMPGHSHDRDAFIPFGAGPRICIGNTFALTEMALAVARITQHFRLELTSKKAIKLRAGVTLTPGEPVRMRVLPRS